MATHGWGSERPVVDRLFANGEEFDFYQAVRLLELLYPSRARVGGAYDPARETVRFTSYGGLEFPHSDVRRIAPPAAGLPAVMMVNFMGLAGAMGPMPLPYTEKMLQRVAEKDTAMRDFLDMFNHRLLSLAYRARRLHRIGLETQTADRSALAGPLFGLIGLGTGGLKRRMEVDDRSLLHVAGLLTQHTRPMAGLEAIVAEYFDLEVHGVAMVGGWLEIDPAQQTVIGRAGRNHVLGDSAVLGRRFWDQTRSFELHVGPVPYARLLDFLPGGSAFAPLCALVRFYAGTSHHFALVVEVDRSTPPPLKLGAPAGAAAGTRLGWTTWLGGNGSRAGRYRVRITPHEAHRAGAHRGSFANRNLDGLRTQVADRQAESAMP